MRTSTRSRRTVVGFGLTIALAGAAALGGCGSDDESGTAPSASSSPSAKLKGEPFNLAAICSCSGPYSAVYGEQSKSARVWAADINARGGINGHPVKVTTIDDGGSPAKALQEVKKLIEQQKVQALVSVSTTAMDSFASYLTSKGVPAIAGENAHPSFIKSPGFFATGATLPVQYVGMAGLAKAAGKTTIGAMYCAEAAACKQVAGLVDGAAKLFGMKSASVSIASAAPSYAAPCLAMKGKGVDALYVGSGGSTVQKVVDDCAQQGYKPAIVGQAATLIPSWLEDANFEGAQLVSPNAIYTDTGNPGVAAFTAAIKKYEPALLTSPQFTQTVMEPWIGGTMFAAAAKAGRLTPKSTPADVTNALYRIKDNDLGGLSAPITIAPKQPVFVPCYYGATVSDGALKAIGDGKPACLTKQQTTALFAGLKKLG